MNAVSSTSRSPRRLMVVSDDLVSGWIGKGELVPRYYNPEDVFDEVHLLLTNDDRPPVDALQEMAGAASLEVHNVPTGERLLTRTLGYRPRLLRRWGRGAVDVARAVRPDVVRSYGVGLNSFLAYELKRVLGIPYAISLHGNPDVDYYRGRLATTYRSKLHGRAIESAEVVSLKHADIVLPVYSPILPYLRKHGIERYELIYNFVGRGAVPKSDYGLDPSAVKTVCVGRQQSQQKDPAPIIDAVAELPGVRLHLIGDGDLHESLVERARCSGAADRIRLTSAMPNRDVLAVLADADLYLYSSVNFELSKTCIEAALTGLPIVIGDRMGEPAEELQGDHMRLVAPTKEGFRSAIEELVADDAERARLGRSARRHAAANWAPEEMERRVADVYRRLLAQPRVSR
jgi:glycosyltransferase involved in cell wall biosynthesis